MKHSLTNVSPDTLIGDCSICGPRVEVRPSGRFKEDGTPWWRCKHAYKMSKLATERPWVFHKGDVCEWCGFVPESLVQLSVDHIDGSKANNDPSNYQTLCLNCHALKTQQNNDYVKKLSI